MYPKSSTIQPMNDPIYARVRERLRVDILSGVFDAGSRLKIAMLCERYAVSQMPIREALQQLQGEGLICIEPNKGASVRKIDEQFVSNLYEIRGALEALLARLAIPNLQAPHRESMRKTQASFEAAIRRGDAAQALELDAQFHRTLYQAADNSEALDWVERQRDLIRCLRRKYGFGPARTPAIIREHRGLLLALDHENAIEAEAAAREHCENAKLDLMRLMNQKLECVG
ncbi:MAG: GntR family transcriptional regulator [Candidatus Hinthialibacter antarcticus]|nr:GntR family transcriptional regulator [Candidatus Hinthialibacter antarcticus]